MSLRDKKAAQSTCYEKAEGIPALRVELENGESFVFPYIHLQFAQKGIFEGAQILGIQYSSHQIQILGSGLQTLINAIQKMELSVIAVSSAQPTKSTPCTISSITVTSLAEGGEKEHDLPETL